ncbi:MAG: PqqD family protein [Candidatus Omnitrophota bacterium]|jgi:hypothetical protein
MLKDKSQYGHRPIINKRQLAWRAIDGELIILYMPDNKVCKLNPMGLYIWNQIDGQKSLRNIIDHIKAEFDTPPEDGLDEDIFNFIDGLLKHDIIKYE